MIIVHPGFDVPGAFGACHRYSVMAVLDKDTDLNKLAIQQTYHQFLKKTRLHKHRPDADLQLTLMGGYSILMEHIQVHQYYLEQKKAASVIIEEAACSWYDRVYTPIAVILRSHHMMRRFPHRTETDFYIWAKMLAAPNTML